MTIKINYNNQEILSASLYQALPQMEMQNSGLNERIVVGFNGGLAFRLMPTDYRAQIAVSFRVDTKEERAKANEFLDSIDAYLTMAETHAREHKFKLVTATDRQKDITVRNANTDTYLTASIGDEVVRSPRRLEAFLEMVKSGYGKLDEQYAAIIEASKQFPVLEPRR